MSSQLAKFTEDAYTADLAGRTLVEVRSRRDECQSAENALSYARRLVHGRLDIIGTEIRRRAAGEAPSDLADLLEHLPETLSDGPRNPVLARPPQDLEPSAVADEYVQRIDAAAPADEITAMSSLDDSRLQAMVADLQALEAELSMHRKALHSTIDTLQADIIRRYRTGEASVDTLLD